MTPSSPLRVLTWNLFHGRDRAPDRSLHTWRSRLLKTTERAERFAQVNRPLLGEFARVLDSWEWDLALLQEAPPRWLEPLGRRCRASGALALTSRNTLPASAAECNPDLIASNEGGSNMVLTRAPARVEEVARVTLARRPERRRLLLARVRLPAGAAVAVGCVHLSVPETGRSAGEALYAAAAAEAFAGDDPLILGGDFNLRPIEEPDSFISLKQRFGLAAPTSERAIDHVLARGLEVLAVPLALAPDARDVPGPDGLRLRLSDHASVTVTLGVR